MTPEEQQQAFRIYLAALLSGSNSVISDVSKDPSSPAWLGDPTFLREAAPMASSAVDVESLYRQYTDKLAKGEDAEFPDASGEGIFSY